MIASKARLTTVAVPFHRKFAKTCCSLIGNTSTSYTYNPVYQGSAHHSRSSESARGGRRRRGFAAAGAAAAADGDGAKANSADDRSAAAEALRAARLSRLPKPDPAPVDPVLPPPPAVVAAAAAAAAGGGVDGAAAANAKPAPPAPPPAPPPPLSAYERLSRPSHTSDEDAASSVAADADAAEHGRGAFVASRARARSRG